MVVSFRDPFQRNEKEGLVSGVEVYTVEHRHLEKHSKLCFSLGVHSILK